MTRGSRVTPGTAIFSCIAILVPVITAAQPADFGAFSQNLPAHRLESIEIQGSSRIDLGTLKAEFGLKPGTVLNDELVANLREKLLSLGLFRSVFLYQRKGTRPGWSKLLIELEDDESVLTDWALGGLIGITYQEKDLSAGTTTPAFGYKMRLLGRNLFRSLHRGMIYGDSDAKGVLRDGTLAYGLPRFAKEDIQFDLAINLTDVEYRYLNAMAFGVKAEGAWTKSYGSSELQLGPAMYLNRDRHFQFPGFPRSAAGPKVSYIHETRLIRFFPGSGYHLGASALYNVTKSYQSILELAAAYTFDLGNVIFITLDGRVLTIGRDGYSFRAENRYDIPLGNRQDELANLFIRLRAGSDEFESTHLIGQSAIVGMRYYSSGLIAEIGLKITKSPQEFVDNEFEFNRRSHR